MLLVHELSLELVALVHRDVMPKARVGDPDTADQLSRAVRSTPLNIAEGEGYGRSRRQSHHFKVALGSGREAFTALRVPLATDVVSTDEASASVALSDRVNKMLFGLLRKG